MQVDGNGTRAVQPGQVWFDNDKRAAGRKVRVDSVHGKHADCTIVADRTDLARRKGKYDMPRPEGWSAVGLGTRILLGRFKPTSTGYGLLPEPDWARFSAVPEAAHLQRS